MNQELINRIATYLLIGAPSDARATDVLLRLRDSLSKDDAAISNAQPQAVPGE